MKSLALPGCYELLLAAALVFTAGCNPETPVENAPPSTLADQPGAYAVGTYDTSFVNDFGTYQATVYYPATTAGVGQPAASTGAPYPVLTVSPGLASQKDYNRWIGQHMASHGYVTLIFTVPANLNLNDGYAQQSQGLIDAFDKLAVDNAGSLAPISGLLDLSKRGLIGHSLGAMGSIAAAADIEVSAVVALAPAVLDASVMSLVTEPVQVQVGTSDCITRPSGATNTFNGVGALNKELVVIDGGNHVGFNDEDSIAFMIGNQVADCPATVDAGDYQQRLSKRFMLGWMDYFVKGDAGAYTYIFGSSASQDLVEGWLSKLTIIKP